MKPSYGPKLTSELKLMTQRIAVLEDAVRSLLPKEGPTAGLPSSEIKITLHPRNFERVLKLIKAQAAGKLDDKVAQGIKFHFDNSTASCPFCGCPEIPSLEEDTLLLDMPPEEIQRQHRLFVQKLMSDKGDSNIR